MQIDIMMFCCDSYNYFLNMKDNSKMNLEAINILKGLAYSQLELEDEKSKMINSGYFNEQEVFAQIDRKMLDKITCIDLINFLSIHRIAVSERQCQYLIWLAGSNDSSLTKSQFIFYLTNGRPESLDKMQSSALSNNMNTADLMIRNNSERQLAKIFEKQIEYYRAIELLRQEFVKTYGFQFNNIIAQIDKEKKRNISINMLIAYVQSCGIEFSVEQFQALARKIKSKNHQYLSYKQIMRAFSPFEPLNFPTYRKSSNIQKAMDYINDQVKKLDIDIYNISYDESQPVKTKTGFQKIVDEFRNPVAQRTHTSTKYFYDKNYYNELRQYKATYFDPNKDVKRKLQTDMVGPQYHDHFFTDYYLYLQERNKSQHYYNKFGKRYTFENPIAKTLDNRI